MGFPCGSVVKNSPVSAGDTGLIPGSGRSLEKETATHSSVLTWKIPQTYCPWGHKEADMTSPLNNKVTRIHCIKQRIKQ